MKISENVSPDGRAVDICVDGVGIEVGYGADLLLAYGDFTFIRASSRGEF